jgi:Protein of unknown function (DUF5131)
VFVNSISDLFHARVPDEFILRVFAVMQATPRHTYQVLTKRSLRLPWPRNVWMGVSVEDDNHLRRVDDLRHVPAAVRFVFAEPLLGPLPSLDLHGVDWLIAGGESGHRARPVDPSWVAELRDACTDAEVVFFFKQWGGRTPKAGGRNLAGRTWNALLLTQSRWPLDMLLAYLQLSTTARKRQARSTSTCSPAKLRTSAEIPAHRSRAVCYALRTPHRRSPSCAASSCGTRGREASRKHSAPSSRTVRAPVRSVSRPASSVSTESISTRLGPGQASLERRPRRAPATAAEVRAPAEP